METLKIQEVGRVREVKGSIVKVVGLSSCMNGQLLEINQNAKGMVIGFVEEEVLVLLLGKIEEVKVGDKVYSKMEPFKVPVGEGFIGRIVNSLAQPIDGKGAVVSNESGVMSNELGIQNSKLKTQNLQYPVFREAPSVLERIPITEAFETGIMLIDSSIPIGKGQRELIIGDRMTGKTTICVDAILNQKDKGTICIYCSIGRSYTLLERIVETFKMRGALDYTIVVSATASTSSGEQYLAPYTAAALGEYFMDRGRDVLIVFDDLTKHAWAYRQLSLLLERSPGRGAYPGDIFYLHSQLVERAGKLSPEFGGGSMTFLPIVDTLQGDVTGFIPSNLVSMTDGQIYLDTALFNAGFRPSVDLGLSVSRIGNKVQCQAMKELSRMLRLEYVQYNELIKITRFKSGVMSDDLALRLKHGEVLTQLFIQDKYTPYPLEKQLIFLYALRRNILDELSKDDISNFKENIWEFSRKNFPQAIEKLSREKQMTPEVRQGIDECFRAFFKRT